MPSNHLVLCHPFVFLPSIFPSIRVFSNEWILHIRWSKYCSISPPNECSGLISLRINWWALLAVQVTLKSLLQHHSSKASILQCSVFFMVQLSHPYMTTGKTIHLTRWTFVGKVMSLPSRPPFLLAVYFFIGPHFSPGDFSSNEEFFLWSFCWMHGLSQLLLRTPRPRQNLPHRSKVEGVGLCGTQPSSGQYSPWAVSPSGCETQF